MVPVPASVIAPFKVAEFSVILVATGSVVVTVGAVPDTVVKTIDVTFKLPEKVNFIYVPAVMVLLGVISMEPQVEPLIVPVPAAVASVVYVPAKVDEVANALNVLLLPVPVPLTVILVTSLSATK